MTETTRGVKGHGPGRGGTLPLKCEGAFQPNALGQLLALGAPSQGKLASAPGLATPLWPRQLSKGTCFHSLQSDPEVLACVPLLWAYRGSSTLPGAQHKVGGTRPHTTQGGSGQETKA